MLGSLSARHPFVRRQWTGRWMRWRVWLVIAAVVLLLALGSWLMLGSSALAVTGVQVEGTSVLSSAEVRRAAAVPSGEPLATVDLAAIAARVESLAPVAHADVSRSWPHRVRIDVRERTPVAVVVTDGATRGLDAHGVLFRDYASPPPHLPVVHTSAKSGSDALAEAAQVVGSLPTQLAARVEYVDVATIDRISLHLRDGRTIVWGSAEDSTEKAEVLAALLPASPEAATYDVSVPGRPTTAQ